MCKQLLQPLRLHLNADLPAIVRILSCIEWYCWQFTGLILMDKKLKLMTMSLAEAAAGCVVKAASLTEQYQ